MISQHYGRGAHAKGNKVGMLDLPAYLRCGGTRGPHMDSEKHVNTPGAMTRRAHEAACNISWTTFEACVSFRTNGTSLAVGGHLKCP